VQEPCEKIDPVERSDFFQLVRFFHKVAANKNERKAQVTSGQGGPMYKPPGLYGRLFLARFCDKPGAVASWIHAGIVGFFSKKVWRGCILGKSMARMVLY
jgi:hypothetical protein